MKELVKKFDEIDNFIKISKEKEIQREVWDHLE
jgi:hypothetical protein